MCERVKLNKVYQILGLQDRSSVSLNRFIVKIGRNRYIVYHYGKFAILRSSHRNKKGFYYEKLRLLYQNKNCDFLDIQINKTSTHDSTFEIKSVGVKDKTIMIIYITLFPDKVVEEIYIQQLEL